MNFITTALNKLFKSSNQQELNKIKPLVQKINGLEKYFINFTPEKFIEKTNLENLFIIPSNVELSGIEPELANENDKAFVLKSIILKSPFKQDSIAIFKYANVILNFLLPMDLLHGVLTVPSINIFLKNLLNFRPLSLINIDTNKQINQQFEKDCLGVITSAHFKLGYVRDKSVSYTHLTLPTSDLV